MEKDEETEAKVVPTIIPMSTETSSTIFESTTTSESTSDASPTTEPIFIPRISQASKATKQDLFEALKDLKQPEEQTTEAQEMVTVQYQAVEYPSVPGTSFLQKLPAAVVIAPVAEISPSPTIEAPSATTEALPTKSDESAEPTSPTIPKVEVFPTEFDKLLTTLRDFVARADALTSTEAPKTSPAPEIPQVEQKVEFVNYTVSSEKHNEEVEETKTISKRSLPDADLIPRLYKQHYDSNKNKGCFFNGNSYKLGEAIKTENGCLKCICEYSPIGHCVLKEKCNF